MTTYFILTHLVLGPLGFLMIWLFEPQFFDGKRKRYIITSFFLHILAGWPICVYHFYRYYIKPCIN